MSEIMGPNGSISVGGNFIKVNADGDIEEYIPVTKSPEQQTPSPRTDVSIVSFELNIKGDAPLHDLLRFAGPRDAPQQQPQYPVQPTQPPMQQFVQSHPMQAPHRPYEEASAPTYISYIPQYETEAEQPPVQSDAAEAKAGSLNMDDQYEEVINPKRKVLKRAMAFTALTALVLVSGPFTQISYGGSEAVQICAKNGITSILGNPGCFGDQVKDLAFSSKSFLNFFPPEQK